MTGFRIHVHSIRLQVNLGWGDEERANPQPIEVDLILELANPFIGSDELCDTVDYRSCIDAVVEVVSVPTRLLETIAVRIADRILCDPRIASTRVAVTKCAPPFTVATDGITVSLERGRDNEV
ncbi:MAG: dihydroneopterin aldolase [Ferrimicrobium sp.]